MKISRQPPTTEEMSALTLIVNGPLVMVVVRVRERTGFIHLDSFAELMHTVIKMHSRLLFSSKSVA